MTDSSDLVSADRMEPETTPRQNGVWKAPEIMATLGPTLEKPEDLRKAVVAGARWIRVPCGYRQRFHALLARLRY